MSFTFTTARGLIELKIRRNKCLIELLNIRDAMLKREIKLKYRIILHNQAKKEKLVEINDIEQQQLDHYDLLREDKIFIMTEEINNCEYNIVDLMNELNELQEKQNKAMEEFSILNTQIPNTTVITNVRIEATDDHNTCGDSSRF
jgi:hypothetical protein